MLAARSSSPQLRLRLIVVCLLLAGCPSARTPVAPLGSETLEIGRDGGSLRGIASDGTTVYASIASVATATSVVEARRGSAIGWKTLLAGSVGPLALDTKLLAVADGGTGKVADLAVRGEPGAVVVALDAATGGVAWKRAIDSSEWSVISSLAPVGAGGFVVGGSFSGTLRANDKIVSSAGKIDGFVARLSATGEVDWLIRVGGPHADAVLGVAADGERIAITGTFATGAELQGEPLVAADDKTPAVDVFVAELDGTGKRKWSASFGGAQDDSVAGIAIDRKGRIAVAATVRDKLKIDVTDLRVRGPADGVVVFYSGDGSPGPTVVLGGDELDGLRGIAASGSRMIVGGSFAGAIEIGRETLKASGDDAFLVALDGAQVTGVWPIQGGGREEITAIAGVPGGFVAGVAHTAAAAIDGQPLPSPKDPASGFGVIVRAIR